MACELACRAREGRLDPVKLLVGSSRMLRSRWAVYMLRCADGSLYTGATSDLSRRLGEHQRGKASAYTRSRLPVRLVFGEPANSKGAALRREAALKRLTRSQKLTLIGG
jgi:putative endonuclease